MAAGACRPPHFSRRRMTVFLHATIEVNAAKMPLFLETIEKVVALVTKAGWKLNGAYVQRSGRMHTVIDLWELDDYNHYDRGIRAIGASPDAAAIGAALAESIKSETLVFLEKAPYMR
jgi:hypothetical protein